MEAAETSCRVMSEIHVHISFHLGFLFFLIVFFFLNSSLSALGKLDTKVGIVPSSYPFFFKKLFCKVNGGASCR